MVTVVLSVLVVIYLIGIIIMWRVRGKKAGASVQLADWAKCANHCTHPRLQILCSVAPLSASSATCKKSACPRRRS